MSMKEFCNTIRLFLLQDVQSFRENTVTMKPGRSSTILLVDDFTITPKSETSEAGLLYNIEEDITIDKVGSSIASTYKIQRSSILQLETYPGHEPVFIGTMEWPALVSITTHLNKDMLHIKSKMTQSPL